MLLIRHFIRNQIIFSSKFYLSLVITSVLVLTQILLFHFYISLRSSDVGKFNFFIDSSNKLTNPIGKDWDHIISSLRGVYEHASKFGLDLVVVDPDLLKHLTSSSQSDAISFSKSFKSSQETSNHKSIVHLAIINETSGGQPNIKLFHNSLRSSGYIILKYDDDSQLMSSEVYRRPAHLFDDIPTDGISEHQSSPKLNYQPDVKSGHDFGLYQEREVSKIYTEFIAHLFITNHTSYDFFTVIHVFILYNYEYSPNSHWIQSGLTLSEIEKHKLLSYNVHSFDFRIPVENYYIHPKKDVISVNLGNPKTSQRKLVADVIRVFEPEDDRLLSFVNNTYIHCRPSKFNITGLIGGSRRAGSYLSALDSLTTIKNHKINELMQQQLVIAFQFMNTFSRVYGNFSYWLTGSTLLSYQKLCDLASMPIFFGTGDAASNKSSENLVINLELGIFSSEVNDTTLNDLANAQTIGVVMLADWRKSNTPITFQLRECPNLMIILHLYDLRKDFYQRYFVTRSVMTVNLKFSRRLRVKPQMNTSMVAGHHIFNTNNLEICWTRVGILHPFRVPCNVYDHLRRIYIV